MENITKNHGSYNNDDNCNGSTTNNTKDRPRPFYQDVMN